MKIDISFLSPTSIFEEEILITAKDEIGDKALIEFKGIKGIFSAVSTFKVKCQPNKTVLIDVKIETNEIWKGHL